MAQKVSATDSSKLPRLYLQSTPEEPRKKLHISRLINSAETAINFERSYDWNPNVDCSDAEVLYLYVHHTCVYKCTCYELSNLSFEEIFN